MGRLAWAIRCLAVACLFSAVASPVAAAPIHWTDWTTATTGSAATASGVIAPLGITVSYTGQISPPAQTAGGTYYWGVNSSIYTSAEVSNPPPDPDIIRLIGGIGVTQTITFSQPVTDPVMAILSLGNSGPPIFYDFNAPFDVLSFGPGFFGGGTLTELAGDVLQGQEGHGTIRFRGTFTSISWTVPIGENWHGFQIGLAEIPEPTTLLLCGLAGAGVVAYRLRRRVGLSS